MHPLARGVRWLLQPLGWFTHALTLVACGFSLWAMALHWVMPFLGIVQAGFLMSWLLAGVIWTVRLATRGAIWLFQPATRGARRPGARMEVTDNVFLSGTKAGFAHCPHGCGAREFPPTFAETHRGPVYIPLSQGWYWWEQYGSDM